MALIVNADDFGKSQEVNKAIEECFNRGFINRTTIMVNMPYAEEAYEIAEKNGFVDKVGIHLNLTEGVPLTDNIKQNRDFCDENGKFNATFYRSTKKRLYMDGQSVEDITEELKEQLDKYAELGFSLNHIDSHHHVHTNYPVFKALKRLSKGYHFSSIRLSRNLYKGGSKLNRLYKYFFNKSIKKICDSTTDYFGSFKDAVDFFATEYNEESTSNASEKCANFYTENDLEIMVHPMYKDGILVDTDIPFEKEILLYEVKK
ncbi:MAG: ChbG/HpnK family deacetylase [Lachnospiraceae bacterium]|nr:ChbG/HpnK family deacetylase [Lachnospiraceae bacterium]